MLAVQAARTVRARHDAVRPLLIGDIVDAVDDPDHHTVDALRIEAIAVLVADRPAGYPRSG